MTIREFQIRWQIRHLHPVAVAPALSAAASRWDRRLAAIKRLAEQTRFRASQPRDGGVRPLRAQDTDDLADLDEDGDPKDLN